MAKTETIVVQREDVYEVESEFRRGFIERVREGFPTVESARSSVVVVVRVPEEPLGDFFEECARVADWMTGAPTTGDESTGASDGQEPRTDRS